MEPIENILIFGAHGKIGQILCKKLADHAVYEPTAFIRTPEQNKVFEEMHVPTIVGNIEDPVASIRKHMEGFDCIIFAAGSGGDTGADKTLAVDLDGAVRTMEAAQQAGVSRYLIVSAAGTGSRDVWDQTEGMKHYYIAKHYADRMLRQSRLSYTIFRPVRLTDEPGTGKIRASMHSGEVSGTIPREDVADALITAINMAATMRESIEISAGDQPIVEALERILESNTPQ